MPKIIVSPFKETICDQNLRTLLGFNLKEVFSFATCICYYISLFSILLGFKFTNTSNTSFGAPRGPFGTPAGEKTSQQTPTKLAAGSKKAEYLGQIKALNLQVYSIQL